MPTWTCIYNIIQLIYRQMQEDSFDRNKHLAVNLTSNTNLKIKVTKYLCMTDGSYALRYPMPD